MCTLVLDRLSNVSSRMRQYLRMVQVGVLDARVNSLGLPRLLCEVPLFFSCLLNTKLNNVDLVKVWNKKVLI